MLPGKRDFYRCCLARRSASHVNKEFRQHFQNYAPPSLRVIRTKLCTYHNIYIFIGERAKRARHSHVCSIENRGYIYNWRASEASETLSGLFNRESFIIIIIIMVRANIVLITRKEGGA